MSEYQYYEFVAVDRQLTRDEMDQLRSISSRAKISSTHFCNTYNYGDLKAQPEQMLRDYFDAFVYDSNFSYRRFIVKMPKACFDRRLLERYFPGEHSCFKPSRDHWLIEFCYSDEDCYDDNWWEEGSEGWMGSLLSIRSELMRGDYRSLYIAWLAALEDDEVAENAGEIPVPPGLSDLTASQSALCDFLKLDKYIVEAAAKNSPDASEVNLESCIDNWLDDLPLAHCKKIVKSLLLDESGAVRAEKISTLLKAERNDSAVSTQTTAELKNKARELKAEGLRRAEEERRKELDKYIVDVAAKEPAYWRRVDELFEKRGSSAVYQELSTKLRDLHLVAVREDKVTAYKKRVADLQLRYAKKQSHWQAMRRANFDATTVSGS